MRSLEELTALLSKAEKEIDMQQVGAHSDFQQSIA